MYRSERSEDMPLFTLRGPCSFNGRVEKKARDLSYSRDADVVRKRIAPQIIHSTWLL